MSVLQKVVRLIPFCPNPTTKLKKSFNSLLIHFTHNMSEVRWQFLDLLKLLDLLRIQVLL